MTNLELAGKLQKEAEHFSGAQDIVGMLWDAGAALRNLHTENTALRVTEDNLRQELQECQDQRRAAFRRIEELEAMRAQIGQGEPDDAAAKERDRILSALKRHDWHSSNIWRYYYPSSTGDWVDLRELRKLLAQFPPAPQQRPLTDEPDWRHPKIQGLIGSEARLRITIDLIWQILENPEQEFTASDMEYWDTIHDKLKDALSTTAPQQKPLTDEQINQMWSDAHNDTSTMSLIHVLARAIEAAHNIGEKK